MLEENDIQYAPNKQSKLQITKQAENDLTSNKIDVRKNREKK